ncbi:MarR family transcriptional regulator [Nonomuraea sp. MG754425]|uniref:MarR family winged helix-turn-helix transcriptional regulator n=1 Tax=Nonomuraea sp. MG754425 TaxID=2570319 RepID=UPI001F012DE2|nr:MarR family transcriptional regulator [Nonomuraea sp. MG754425]MCF6469685.1 MarR family transcriptional regulator [Nonomuraea sp. MG754425]
MESDPPSQPVDELELAVGLARIRTMMRLLDVPRDLSITSLSTLANLERLGPRRLTELAAMEGVTQPAMTQLVSRLEREELAERRPDPSDGRAVVVAVTQHGRAELARRRAVQAKRLAELLAEVPAADRAAIAAALPALERLAARAHGLADSPAPVPEVSE